MPLPLNNNSRTAGIISELQRYELWLQEAALNLIMEEALKEWSRGAENGEMIELDDTFFEACTNSKAKAIWSLVKATRNTIRGLKDSFT